MAKDAAYRISLMHFEAPCKHCGRIASAVVERHSDVFIREALFWQCGDECYNALSPLERHNGQAFLDPEALRVFFKRGYIVEILQDGSLISEEVSFSEALRIEKQEPVSV